eukprot:CAMPEP_0206479852 /NCGR_PEP_ID=MMETSP0324_2-20121206/36911_1 /ASSEMBLY_ACC=CAM_ASM_000836 /TAXON_ID=2866 /ORGANISM="Crypthecodinium cohnii, Strain Seligo" /LENGTH=60 /DNA_ID=CAMNT_0053956459 /DNA_START=242 /DNA_END=421 /DNA_ORIENTATION=+
MTLPCRAAAATLQPPLPTKLCKHVHLQRRLSELFANDAAAATPPNSLQVLQQPSLRLPGS